MTLDNRFLARLAQAVDADLAAPSSPQTHRELMRYARLLVATYLWPASGRHGDAALIDAARENVAALRALQGPSGLFIGGDNVDSPPDSSFTINDLCDALYLLETVPHEATPATRALIGELHAIADTIESALVTGGVHTPNHRWEISAALARLHRRRPSQRLADRASEWLAEGIDIAPDGTYSERSANYAAHVSNPSLSVIADVFGRADARDAVIRNLESTLGLIHPDATVETVHSRRQDQLTRFSASSYLALYRRYAVELGRGDFAWAAERALEAGVAEPDSVLTELLIHEHVGHSLPDPVVPAASGVWEQCSLAVDATDRRRLVVFGGSDYSRVRRIRSGLSTNPTFLRMFAGPVTLDAVRLSRDFFGLGPFRAASLRREGERYVLHESVSASYYQPLLPDAREDDGAYELSYEGRFYSAMSFSERARDEVSLLTRVTVHPTDDGAELEISIDGPDCAWSLELAFRGGEFDGSCADEEGRVLLESGTIRYRAGGAAIAVVADDGYRAQGPASYRPGEDYAFLGATDAVAGDRLYLTGRGSTVRKIALRAENDEEETR